MATSAIAAGDIVLSWPMGQLITYETATKSDLVRGSSPPHA